MSVENEEQKQNVHKHKREGEQKNMEKKDGEKTRKNMKTEVKIGK